MTLKEKLDIIKGYDEQDPYATFMTIADESAIEFAEWIRENYYDVGDSWCEWNSDKDTYSSKELLEIFKKEKGL